MMGNGNPVLRDPPTSLCDEKTEMMELPYSLPKNYGIGHVISIYIHDTAQSCGICECPGAVVSQSRFTVEPFKRQRSGFFMEE